MKIGHIPILNMSIEVVIESHNTITTLYGGHESVKSNNKSMFQDYKNRVVILSPHPKFYHIKNMNNFYISNITCI